jgi:hypothetical protein
MSRFRLHVAAAVVAMALPSFAWADRPPTDEERARVEAALRAAGFVSWRQIEWEDEEHWEVDDATDNAGRKFDLTLDPDLKILTRDPD